MWGEGSYYNLKIGESIYYNDKEVKLLQIHNHYNQIKVGSDTLWLKVARRTVPIELDDIRIFVADNRKVNALGTDSCIHNLLIKDVLLCISQTSLPLLNFAQYHFPVSFNDGFVWNAEEDSYTFSFYRSGGSKSEYYTYPGIGFNMHDARGMQRHWLISVENSRVVWIDDSQVDKNNNQSCILLQSESNPNIYYAYNGIYNKNVVVKKGQRLMRGDAIGAAWGDDTWGHVQFTVINSKTEPLPGEGFCNVVNVFPQLFNLYFRNTSFISKSFSRGKIVFGKPRRLSGNQIFAHEYENYSGRGWITGKWNPADKVEWISEGMNGNVRLKKVLFEGTHARARNPEDHYEFQIAVSNGTYRIRAKVGDVQEASWQKIEFEGVGAAVKSLNAGEFDWTGERVVQVKDGTLNTRIYIDPKNVKVAGISEIVFQKVN